MKHKFLILLTFYILTLSVVPASALGPGYIENKLKSWIASQKEYEIIYSEVGLITPSPSISFTFELDPGYYKFIGEGGESLSDLDMFVYDELGYEIDSDTELDNYPICEIEIEYPTEIMVELTAVTFEGGVQEDYFFIMAVGTPADVSSGDFADEFDPGDVIDYWTNWAVDLGYEPIMSDRGVLNRDLSDTFEIDLQRGTYHIFSESLRAGDDIDMTVYNKDSEVIAQDLADDNYPLCTFNLLQPSSVTIEIVPCVYESGTSTEYVIVVASEGVNPITGPDAPFVIDPDIEISPEADNELINSLRNDYMELITERGLTNIYDESGAIEAAGKKEIRITLGRGSYIIYAHGGLRILDLDVRVYNDDGYIVAEDILINNSPVCEFSNLSSGLYRIEIEAYEMQPGWFDGNYLVIVARK